MRIKIIDALKGVAIVAVVIGHILSFSGIQGLVQTIVYKFIYNIGKIIEITFNYLNYLFYRLFKINTV
jgi:surface polysaccharide O-acyltransferase-like enzyme